MSPGDLLGPPLRGRTFLFLQGPSSPLFARIAAHLDKLGHRCLRVNLCAGDWVFWRRQGGINYRGRLADWPAFIAKLMDTEGVGGIVLLGEERPHHLAAAEAAKARGIPVYAVEMGYLRPDWIRIERDGSGYHSHFPTDPAVILKAAAGLPEPDLKVQHYTQSFLADAVYDLLFNLPNVFLRFLYPHYRWHAIFHPLAEYAGWVARLLQARGRARRRMMTLQRIHDARDPYFVFPLQLETDYQIRAYSNFRSQRDAIALVIESFAANAAPDARLLFKVHPLDNGLIPWEKEIAAHARRKGIADRVHFVDGGNLARMIMLSAGVVTINSTAGIVGLQRGKPVKALGVAIFDIPGLTDPGPLDRFWREGAAPDPELVDAFLRLIAATLHVRGNFYSWAGVEAGAEAIARRLHEGRVNEPGGFVSVPPRMRPVDAAP
ncbi:capsule biosynthesis protein [Kumtagia ephedrae]|uniref:Capsular biosynthesis protein n=1 Tax=Kumtagia ephedrae TaxID=2116701 RepID=A0A2P7SFJ9_9HYPH|nr:capsular biosynthesis protein [Mesorhizobium ephedrae]PSJ61165.1 capsular biosynthesis protein [Mesorhizobium ephedrae]